MPFIIVPLYQDMHQSCGILTLVLQVKQNVFIIVQILQIIQLYQMFGDN